jgi:hypothetical protein
VPAALVFNQNAFILRWTFMREHGLAIDLGSVSDRCYGFPDHLCDAD